MSLPRITHTSSPLYPLDRAARQVIRADYHARIMASAAWQAQIAGLSVKCGPANPGDRADHAGTDGGCKNTGATCLCACHDRESKP